MKSHDSRFKFALKKPEQKVNLKSHYELSEKTKLNLDAYWISSQYDFGNNKIQAYDVFNLTLQHTRKSFTLKFGIQNLFDRDYDCLLYTSPSPRDKRQSRMPSSA